MEIRTRKDPIKPTVEAIESMQQNVDYWGKRAEKAEDERNRLWEVLMWIDAFDPEATAAAEDKFKFSIVAKTFR